MTDLEKWVLEGARDGLPSFRFFPSSDHTAAWERVKARGWIETRDTTFALTASGRAALSGASAR